MENQFSDPQALSQSQGIPGMTTTDDTPIAPPEGYEDSPQENIMARVRATMDKFNHDMELMAQGIDPHPPVPVTVEEIDGVLQDIHGILAIQPGNDMAKEMQDKLLFMRQRIIHEQATAQTQMAQEASVEQPQTQPEPIQEPVVEEPNPQVLTTEQVQQVHQEEDTEVDQSIAALQNDDNPFSMEEPAPTQTFDATQAQFAAEPPAEEVVSYTGTVTLSPEQMNQVLNQPVYEPTQVTVTNAAIEMPLDVEPPTIVEDTEENDKVVITRRQVHRADMPTAPDGRRINSVFNKTLETFIRGYMKDKGIDDDLDIIGAPISNSANVGVFEEGGASQREGSVLLATDSNGHKLPALVSYAHKEAVNGKHALITVFKDNYIILGGQQQGRAILGIYRIVNTKIRKDKKNKNVANIMGELVAFGTGGEDFAFEETATAHDRSIWHPKHPAVEAAFTRMYEHNAERPIYIQDYRDCFCDTDDLVRMMSNQNILSTIQDFNSLDEAYAKIGAVLAAEVTKCLNTNDLPTLSVVLNYLPDYNTVVVYLIGSLYDKAKKTSMDRCVIYARVALYPGSEMYYPDKSDDPNARVPYTTLVERISHTGGKMVASLRRVTK